MLRVGGVIELMNANYDFAEVKLARQNYLTLCDVHGESMSLRFKDAGVDFVPKYELERGILLPENKQSRCNFFKKVRSSPT